MPDVMHCRELVELVTEYLELALPPDQRALFERHLAECADCRHYVAQVELTAQLLAGQRRPHLPPDQRAALEALYQRWRAEASS